MKDMFNNKKNKQMKNISQYNWGWWFVLTLIGIVVGMLVGMVAKTSQEIWWANGIMITSVVSLIPCLYIGMKPGK